MEKGMKYVKSLSLLMGLLVCAHSLAAGVVVGGTRVIYSAEKKEALLTVSNTEQEKGYLIQSWVECVNAPQTCSSPLTATPPLFRLDAGKENIIRLIKRGEDLPANQESVFWLNIKSIPATKKSDANALQISVRTKVKVFYRPAGLNAHDANNAFTKLKFTAGKNFIDIYNPTAYHISFFKIKIDNRPIYSPGMVSPYAHLRLPANSAHRIEWSAINDQGGITKEASFTL